MTTRELRKNLEANGISERALVEKMMNGMANQLEAIEISVCDSPADLFNGNVVRQYVSQEDISRELIKRCTNKKVLEKLMEGYSVIEAQPGGLGLGMIHVTSYIKKNFGKVAVVIGNKVMVA